MSIYTRRGDHGETSLADGTRVSKASARVEAYGAVDEANSAVGFARAAVDDKVLDSVLSFAQQKLFNCSCSLADPTADSNQRTPVVTVQDVGFLESAVDRFEQRTGPLECFVVEGGSEAAARLHVARTVCRRAERRMVTLTESEPVEELVLSFVNRLSDTLFAAARYANALAGTSDEPWDPTATPPTE